MINNEDDFQAWVMEKFNIAGHVFDHRHSALPDVPDLSAAADGKDYWLELKYGEFKMLHSGYDKLRFKTTRGQLNFLIRRSLHGSALCGIMAYFKVSGDYPVDGGPEYLFYMNPIEYLARVFPNQKVLRDGICVGTAMLSRCVRPAHSVRTARDLLDFIEEARHVRLPKRS